MNKLWDRTSYLDRIEAWANWLTDWDWAWWPFLFLRPVRSAPISTLRVARMAIYFAPIVGLGVMFGISALRGSFDVGVTAGGIAAINVALFLLFRLTFAFFWNRRAARLVSCRLLSRGAEAARR